MPAAAGSYYGEISPTNERRQRLFICSGNQYLCRSEQLLVSWSTSSLFPSCFDTIVTTWPPVSDGQKDAKEAEFHPLRIHTDEHAVLIGPAEADGTLVYSLLANSWLAWWWLMSLTAWWLHYRNLIADLLISWHPPWIGFTRPTIEALTHQVIFLSSIFYFSPHSSRPVHRFPSAPCQCWARLFYSGPTLQSYTLYLLRLVGSRRRLNGSETRKKNLPSKNPFSHFNSAWLLFIIWLSKGTEGKRSAG